MAPALVAQAQFPAPHGKVEIFDAGQTSGRRVMHAMTTNGCIETDAGTWTATVLQIQSVGAKAPLGRKAAAEASKPDGLMYIKEKTWLRRIADGRIVVSGDISNSADGTVDVWDGEEVVMHVQEEDGTPSIVPYLCGDFELVIQRTTKCFTPEHLNMAVIRGELGAIEAMQAAEEKATRKEEWSAPLQAPSFAAAQTRTAVHAGVICDATEMNPIVGRRFHKVGADYDICEAAFAKLSLEEKVLFERIDTPGATPVKMVHHQKFTCDATNWPIIGPRYHKVGHDYDLCEAAFEQRSPEEQQLFEKILQA